MLIEFRSGDRMLGIKALGIYEKGLDAATTHERLTALAADVKRGD